MIELATVSSSVRLLPDEGGVATELVVDGRAPLCSTPFSPATTGDAVARDEEAWVQNWRGGWQLCFPTAGQADPRAAPAQGFHGVASQAAWTVIERGPDWAVLEWWGDGLRVQRRWTLHPDGLGVSTTVEAEEAAQVIIAEHLILGSEALDRPLTIEAPAGTLLALLAYDGSPSDESVDWPGDPREDWGAIRTDTPARLSALMLPDTPWRELRAVGRHMVARLRWDGAAFPHALLWAELGATQDPPWCGRIRALGIEPTTTPHGAGTSAGGAVALAPGDRLTWSCRLHVTWIGEPA